MVLGKLHFLNGFFIVAGSILLYIFGGVEY